MRLGTVHEMGFGRGKKNYDINDAGIGGNFLCSYVLKEFQGT